ncbi:MAG: oligosaccharide flippase family protein [Lutibacter sp.]|uniref:oligosaccharide flippase family protein n=1 Tax=Lutibacter sp. TaxID=1925666 RepID=UPI00299EC1CE|nr:oligosaccharide flippase family protein [Lutibacter sp.]MDX1828795.1 oligosaccharide flippase family protein [Lutibacter sp.]
MNGKKIYKFSENTLSLFSIKAIELGLTIFLIPYLISKVGLLNYGSYAFAMALIIFLQNVMNYGFNLATVREVAKNKKDKRVINEIFSTVFSVKIFLLIVIYGFLLTLIFLIPEYYSQKKMYFFASFLLIGDLFSLRWFFLGMEQMKFKAIINFFYTLLYLLFVLILVQNETDFYWIPFAEGMALLIVSMISFVMVIHRYQIIIKLISISEIINYLKLNFSAFVNLLLPSTFSIVAVFLVGVFGMPTQVSFMQVGVKVSNAFCTLNSILTLAFYPMVNRNKSIMFNSRVVLLTIGVILSLTMYFTSDYLITNWLRIETSENINHLIKIVYLLSPMPILVAIISSYGINGLLPFLKDKIFSYINVFSMLFMILLAWILIPVFKFYGGAIAFLGARFVHAGLSYFLFKKMKKSV